MYFRHCIQPIPESKFERTILALGVLRGWADVRLVLRKDELRAHDSKKIGRSGAELHSVQNAHAGVNFH